MPSRKCLPYTHSYEAEGSIVSPLCPTQASLHSRFLARELPATGGLGVLTERKMEDAIAANPQQYLGEEGLELLARQHRIGGYIFDLLFRDRHGAKLIVEIQRGTLDRNHTYKILDYHDEYKERHQDSRRAACCGSRGAISAMPFRISPIVITEMAPPCGISSACSQAATAGSQRAPFRNSETMLVSSKYRITLPS